MKYKLAFFSILFENPKDTRLLFKEDESYLKFLYKKGKYQDFLKYGISDVMIHKLLKEKKTLDVDTYIEKYYQLNIQIIDIDDKLYPSLLKEIKNPPPFLFAKGESRLLAEDFLVAVVGARKNSLYGQTVINELIPFLTSHRYPVVSGMANGIDSLAHKVCLKKMGKTIAVLGCSVEQIYPKCNASLYCEIEQKGLIISEFPLGVMPQKRYFPRRNRIISGLCQTTFVIEATIKSGSLITARYAFEQNRDVFAAVGDFDRSNSVGNHYLIDNNIARIYYSNNQLKDYFNTL